MSSDATDAGEGAGWFFFIGSLFTFIELRKGEQAISRQGVFEHLPIARFKDAQGK
jgi:hypothetical protein